MTKSKGRKAARVSRETPKATRRSCDVVTRGNQLSIRGKLGETIQLLAAERGIPPEAFALDLIESGLRRRVADLCENLRIANAVREATGRPKRAPLLPPDGPGWRALLAFTKAEPDDVLRALALKDIAVLEDDLTLLESFADEVEECLETKGGK